MLRRSRRLLPLGAVLLSAAACAPAPTDPPPIQSTMSPHVEPLLDGSGGDSTCRNGWDIPNGKAC